MRCKICDNEASTTDPKTGDFLCSYCSSYIQKLIGVDWELEEICSAYELEEDEEEEEEEPE